MVVLLFACNGADPDWDVYPLLSFGLAELPGPRLLVQLTPTELTVALDGQLPCPIPVSSSVTGVAGQVPMALQQGGVHGTGLGSACVPTMLVVARAELPAGELPITLTDGTTTWRVVLADPLAERAMVLAAAEVARGGTLGASLLPATDRWVPDAPGAEPTRLVLTSQVPGADCTPEVEVLLPADPGPTLALTVPADFCPGSAYATLSTSARRSAVLACPTGVVCKFDPGGFVAAVVVAP